MNKTVPDCHLGSKEMVFIDSVKPWRDLWMVKPILPFDLHLQREEGGASCSLT